MQVTPAFNKPSAVARKIKSAYGVEVLSITGKTTRYYIRSAPAWLRADTIRAIRSTDKLTSAIVAMIDTDFNTPRETLRLKRDMVVSS